MTTIFGITHEDTESVVLVGDRQTTQIDSNTKMPNGKYLGRKLWKASSGDYCFGHAGMRDAEHYGFIEKLCEGKYDIEKIVTEKSFPQLRDLNIQSMGDKFPDPEKMSGFILATRFQGKPHLYTCFPLGAVEERNWTTLGSGSPKVTEYMDALRILSEARDYLFNRRNKFQLADLIRIGLEAVRRSQSKDVFSHGLDMMVCNASTINDHFTELDDDFKRKLRRIQRKYPGK